MKTKIFTVLILVIPFYASGQMNSSIDLITGIEYSYRYLNTSSENEIMIQILESRNQKEAGKLNWRFGFNYNKRLSSNFYLKTGIRLASVGRKGEKITDLRWGSEHDGLGHYAGPDPDLPHEIQHIHDFWFFEIPVIGRMELSNKRLSPFVELGVSPSIYFTKRVKSITDIGTEVEFEKANTTGIKKLHLVGSVSFGVNYLMGEKMQVFGQPIFRYHLTPLVDAPIGEFFFNYGVEIGVRRKIN